MIPHLDSKDIPIFYKYLDKSKVYFEYGCGGSTYQACLRESLQTIYSVESDKSWIDKLKTLLPKNKNVNFIFIDLKTTGNWGRPGPLCDKNVYPSYSRSIHTVQKPDLVFIDGRFRVACALHCFKLDVPILFDDFLDRPHYHIVLKYFDIVEKGQKLVVLKKKNVDPPSLELITKYEFIAD